MFQPKAFFYAGLKIIGVLAIIWSFTQIVPVISQFYSVYNQPDMMTGNDLRYFRFSLLFQVVYPILLFVIGIYLLKDGGAIVQLAFREYEESENKIGELFVLFMKLAGLVLMIDALPRVFQILSNAIFVSSAGAVGTSNQAQFIMYQLVSTIINLLLGLYLLRSGKMFYRIGFTKQKDPDEEMGT